MRRLLGFCWAFPLTLVGFVVVALPVLLGWCRRSDTFHEALVWETVRDKAPAWLLGRWCARSVGNVIIIRGGLGGLRKPVIRHELEHVRQAMRLGPFYPMAYACCSLVARVARAHPQFDNPLEIAARRAAGQVVDVVGTVSSTLSRRRRA